MPRPVLVVFRKYKEILPPPPAPPSCFTLAPKLDVLKSEGTLLVGKKSAPQEPIAGKPGHN